MRTGRQTDRQTYRSPGFMFTMVRSKLLRSPVRVFSSAVCVLTVFHCYRALNLHLTHTSPSVFMWRQTGQSEDSEATADCGAEGPLISDLCRGNIHKQTFTLTNDPHEHWVTFDPGMTSGRPGHTCLREGTHNRSRDQCVCRAGWHGAQCGVPTVVQHSNLAHRGRLWRRSQPRRIINAVNVNHEFDLLHARFNELSSAVDLFMVCESNYTAAGGSKPLTFLHMLLNGTLDYVKHKILYVFLDHFPRGAERDGWLADDHFRTFLTRDGLSRVRGSRPDDVFLINDADEIPARAGVLFLKLYDGWTEPVAFHLRRSLYGFYWREPGTLDILSACTLGMLEAVYQNDGILLRRRHHYDLPGYLQYQEDSGRQVALWSIGSQVHFAGWHCSWCFSLEGIHYKLVSAQNGDFPRWGDYPEKRDLGYIKDLVRTGGWFDGSTCKCLPSHRGEPMYAPRFLLDNFPQYRHLLENPYINRSTQT